MNNDNSNIVKIKVKEFSRETKIQSDVLITRKGSINKLEQSPIKPCRVCLHPGIIPIFGDECIGDLSESLCLYGGILITEDDNLPQHICHDCNEQLQSAIMFRKTAIETDKVLRSEPKNLEYKVDIKVEYLDMDTESDTFMETQPDENTKYHRKFKETLADDTTKYHCTLCSEEFTNPNDYGTHMLTEKHSIVKDYCPFCNRKFNYIQKHLDQHRQYKTVKCDVCTKKYLKSMIKFHKSTHFRSPSHKCTECPYVTSYSSDFKVHKRVHSGERPFQCQYCSAKFITSSNLKRHENTHKDQLPHPCNECKRRFHTVGELHLHTKALHQGIKDHLCNICGKAFGYRKAMIKHQRKVHKVAKRKVGRKKALYLKHDDTTAQII